MIHIIWSIALEVDVSKNNSHRQTFAFFSQIHYLISLQISRQFHSSFFFFRIAFVRSKSIEEYSSTNRTMSVWASLTATCSNVVPLTVDLSTDAPLSSRLRAKSTQPYSRAMNSGVLFWKFSNGLTSARCFSRRSNIRLRRLHTAICKGISFEFVVSLILASTEASGPSGVVITHCIVPVPDLK